MADDTKKHTPTHEGAYEAAKEFGSSPLATRMAELSKSLPDALSPEFRVTLGTTSETAKKASETLAPGLRKAFESLGMRYEPSPEAATSIGQGGGSSPETVAQDAREQLRADIEASIPERVRLAQDRAGISQTKMPKASGVPKSTYLDILRGKTKNPSICDLVCIAKATGTTLDYLVGLD